jgi:hypothetical protein
MRLRTIAYKKKFAATSSLVLNLDLAGNKKKYEETCLSEQIIYLEVPIGLGSLSLLSRTKN